MAANPTASERESLVREAKLQTDAIQRLEVWKRLAYSLLAVGFLLGYWGFENGGPAWSGPVGIAVAAVSAIASFVLWLGTGNAKRNVRRILEAAGVDPDQKPAAGKKPGDGKASGDGKAR